MIVQALVISIVFAAVALTVAYGLGAFWIPVVAVLLLAALWIAGQWAGWSWLGWLMVVLFAGAAAFGTLLDLNPLLLVVGLIGAVSAWDLGEFDRQLRRVDAVEHEQALKRSHLQRLAIVDGLGLLIALVARSIQIKLSFGLALVLGIIAILGLSRAIGFLRRESG